MHPIGQIVSSAAYVLVVSDKQALADIMIILCIRPAKIKNLRISNDGVTEIQEAISSGKLGDPESPGAKFLSTFPKKDEFLPETGKLLLPSYLRKLGVAFVYVMYGAKNPSKAMTITKDEIEDLDEFVDKDTEVYLIHEIVLSLISNKYENRSDFSSSGESDEWIEEESQGNQELLDSISLYLFADCGTDVEAKANLQLKCNPS
ncbi:hypothetical protein C1645_821070 [Glomus cerebriforme]|uniref:Uncharacterized protein n=1 Tax=Glomus cerebriforme TaxID=658196 RepID=A0A397T1Z1_9GLOM|nr:hypothetical protein C1645_821070 [Glomus cerebriforme]